MKEEDKMNIGIFSDTYFPQINGVATSIRLLSKELTKRGHNVYIFTTSDPNARQKSPRVFRLPSMPFVFLPSHRMCLSFPPRLITHMKNFKLDIIHTQTEFPVGIFGKIVSEVYRIPLVHTYHTMYEDYVHYIAKGHLIGPKFAKRYSRIFCNRAKAVVAPVEKTRESLSAYGVKRPIHVIPTGIDFEPFKRGRYSKEELIDLKNELGLDPCDPVIVFVGRIAKEKSIDVVLNQFPELLKKIPNAKLLIVGDGPARKALEESAEKMSIRNSVIFTGAKPWDDIGMYYQLGDVFVTASTSETQGLTYIEAMAAKTPVIAKKDRSMEGIIEHGVTGYYFEKDHELGSLLYDVLSDPEALGLAAETAYERIESLSASHFAENIEKLYEEVLKNSPPKRNLGKKIILVIKKPLGRFPKSKDATSASKEKTSHS